MKNEHRGHTLFEMTVTSAVFFTFFVLTLGFYIEMLRIVENEQRVPEVTLTARQQLEVMAASVRNSAQLHAPSPRRFLEGDKDDGIVMSEWLGGQKYRTVGYNVTAGFLVRRIYEPGYQADDPSSQRLVVVEGMMEADKLEVQGAGFRHPSRVTLTLWIEGRGHRSTPIRLVTNFRQVQ